MSSETAPDINMPEMDGYEVAKRLQADPANGVTKIVALSAYSDPAHIARVAESGFHFRLTKPAAPESLLAVLSLFDRKPGS